MKPSGFGRISRRDFARRALLGAGTAGALLLPRGADAGKERLRRILAKRGVSYWAEKSPPAGTSHSAPTQLFPSTNWWNLDISAAPVDANSATLLSQYTDANRLAAGWGNFYGLPFNTVSGNHPKVLFDKIATLAESDNVPYPIPLAAFTQTGWTEYAGPLSPSPAIETFPADADCHLLIIDVDNNRLYEIYQPWRNMTGSPVTGGGVTVNPGELYCYSCATWDMNTNDQRPLDFGSSDAGGLQEVPGLAKYDELMGASDVTHAHRVTLSLTANYYVWPARHQAFNGGTFPNGARLRCKPSVFPTGLDPYPGAQKLLAALKTHGLIVSDNGPSGEITGTFDARWGDYDDTVMIGFAVLCSEKLRFSDFEVIQLGYGEP